jgi:hypothetical protein
MSTNSSEPSQAELGAELSAAAYAQPPLKPEGLALRLIIVIWATAVIATIVVGLRVYVRALMLRRAKVWGWEDTFAVMGYVSPQFPDSPGKTSNEQDFLGCFRSLLKENWLCIHWNPSC